MNNDLEMMKAYASLFRKKAAVMQALEGGMVKAGKNDHFNYKFITASDIKARVSHLLAANGLALKMSGVSAENFVSSVELKGGASKQVPMIRIQFSICLCDVDTGAVDESFWFGEAEARDDKSASKAATSALKYFLISNLLIADAEEDKRDTDNQKRRPPQAETSARAPQTAQGKQSVGQIIASVLPEYQPFMDAGHFERMKAELRSEIKTLTLTSAPQARIHIEKTYGIDIDLETLNTARKEAN